MQQMYSCPKCGTQVAFGTPSCPNCRMSLNWPSQPQTQSPPGNQQQMYSCPNCGSPVAFGARFCTSCGTTLNWLTQQMQPPPIYQQQQRGDYRHGQQRPEQKKTSPLVVAFVALVIVVLLVGGGAFAFDRLSQATPPTVPPAAAPPANGIPAADTSEPVIANVSASSTETSAVVTWTTDEPASSQVEYGTTNNYGSHSVLAQALVGSHSVTLSGLEPNTAYHFRVKSKDSSGNEAVSQDRSVTTLDDTVSPVISGVNASGVTGATATITWTTDELATSQVEYGKTTSYGSSTAVDETLATNHSVALTGLDAETSYHFRVSSADKAGNKAISDDCTFATGEAFSASLNLSIRIGNFIHGIQFFLYNGSADTITVTKVEFFDENNAVVHTIAGADLTELWGNGQATAGESLSGSLSFQIPYAEEEIEGWRVKWHCLDADGAPFDVIGQYSEPSWL